MPQEVKESDNEIWSENHAQNVVEKLFLDPFQKNQV